MWICLGFLVFHLSTGDVLKTMQLDQFKSEAACIIYGTKWQKEHNVKDVEADFSCSPETVVNHGITL